ncbi:conserved hypothetical pox protein [Squirrelpox virus]|uniref:Conserved hypothetical pox protein n=1 Tax=Squirrelpox virus TaxID=240426 RepID=U3UBA4_9POXV|nr:conserved hypothetical pox protein [Squirrelpox virus]CCD83267.1 conserved hypothetical pox protein [Squirrelpox virus]
MERVGLRVFSTDSPVHAPASGPQTPGPHIHFPGRMLVGSWECGNVYMGDDGIRNCLANSMVHMYAVEAASRNAPGLPGRGAEMTFYDRRADPRTMGIYYATARGLSERPLYAQRGWKRAYPAVRRALAAMDARVAGAVEAHVRRMAADTATALAALPGNPWGEWAEEDDEREALEDEVYDESDAEIWGDSAPSETETETDAETTDSEDSVSGLIAQIEGLQGL